MEEQYYCKLSPESASHHELLRLLENLTTVLLVLRPLLWELFRVSSLTHTVNSGALSQLFLHTFATEAAKKWVTRGSCYSVGISTAEAVDEQGSCCRDCLAWTNSYSPVSRWACRVAVGARSSEESEEDYVHVFLHSEDFSDTLLNWWMHMSQ